MQKLLVNFQPNQSVILDAPWPFLCFSFFWLTAQHWMRIVNSELNNILRFNLNITMSTQFTLPNSWKPKTFRLFILLYWCCCCWYYAMSVVTRNRNYFEIARNANNLISFWVNIEKFFFPFYMFSSLFRNRSKSNKAIAKIERAHESLFTF